ncbi:undecaprenyldiphospho-muramoylpentapeptide beta-N-acetylglucosaminyltransferase [Prevotella sp. kh1p2]|uniref:undecaprenyldiphospho-muramoylpentapeptide beta-N-acetylglucosaminyltransferase n=1 Tax=Prevotella sp. kh1p2 TaxID=1761883 RepID=UPI0008CDF622|nr:undecaprenyldiphospho-muramoylpentapeptide beta-N-acetylglucosaminyltransferase [Prevotella sp. kh1p2]SES82762.1 UDP-N-acetylglucosamine-N-acetylmuramylpentapeptide N-acetylglucosamine transferase [Prevotella sp. kh1p2]
MENDLRIIISGGGTGGHIFPAISIANAIKARRPDAKILFVGALGRMEMQRVPAAGYEIKGLPISGFDRKHLLRNVAVLFKVWKSQRMARRIVAQFRPMAAVGVGGYASGPTLNVCAAKGIPCLIQEQNSYAGVTNKLLAKKADKICVAYQGMERFFPADKIVMTGNPVRQNVLNATVSPQEARRLFDLDPEQKTILLVGGSLGAGTINESMLQHLDTIAASPVQFIWQTGKYYNEAVNRQLAERAPLTNLKVLDFISDMGAAYRAADLVISRAGASSISEFCLIGKPVILVPSPNVAEDHQTKNAMALVDKDAAIYVKDSEAPAVLLQRALDTVTNDAKLASLSENIKKLGFQNSAEIIADEVIKLAQNNGTQRH